MSDVYTTRQLAMLLEETVTRPHTFLLDKFFPLVMTFDTELIDFDKITKTQKLAPYVSPFVAGRPVRTRGLKTESFKPAYVKPKTALDPSAPLKRRPGETYAGEVTPAMRRDAHIVDVMEDHQNMIIRRKEYMAAEVLRTGKLVVSGEDFPTQEVDFGRHNDLSVALTLTDRWGEDDVDPLDDIEDWLGTVQGKSGVTPTDVVMDPKAWQLCRRSQRLLDSLDNRRQSSGNVELGPIATRTELRSARYLGTIGDIDLWVYEDIYEDDAGTVQKMLPDYTVLLAGSGIEGVQAHGAIRDPRAGYAAVEQFPTNWIENDPVAEFVMTQSAPLVVPARPNGCMRVTVHDGDFGE